MFWYAHLGYHRSDTMYLPRSVMTPLHDLRSDMLSTQLPASVPTAYLRDLDPTNSKR